MSKKDSFKNIFGKVEEDIKSKIVVRDEFKNLIPPLAQEEFSQLEENILLEGCRESLIIWQDNTDYVLIDGHNRFQICQKHKLDFKYEIKQFADKEAAKSWMINNQLGRRNLTLEQQSYLRGKRYESEKQSKGGYDKVLSKGQNVSLMELGSEDISKGQNVPLTSERLGEEYGVSEKTIKRDADFAKGLDKIGESNPQLKQNILSGKSNIKKAEIQKISKLPKEEINKIKTEEDLVKLTQSQSKVVKQSETKPSITTMLEALDDSGSNVIIEIKGKFLIEKDLSDYWQKLRKLKTPITEDFTDYLTWGQAKAIGLVK